MNVLDDFPYHGDQTRIIKMRAPLPLYVRFGHFQSDVGETSMNWSTGEYEKGISVYPGLLLANDEAIVDPEWAISSFDPIFNERYRYALTGTESAYSPGSDGEPLLIPSSIVIRGVTSPSNHLAGIRVL